MIEWIKLREGIHVNLANPSTIEVHKKGLYCQRPRRHH